jgi:hypothetical protein
LCCLFVVCNPAGAQLTTWVYNGGGNWSDANNWDAGAPGAGSLVVIDEGDWSVDVVLDIDTVNPIDGLTIGSDDSLSMGHVNLRIDTGSVITNDGQIRLNAGASYASNIRFSGDATLTGSGDVSMSNSYFNSLMGVGLGNGVLTHGAAHTIHGAGAICNLGMGLINHGLVNADIPYAGLAASLNIRPGTGVNINGTDVDVINDGVLRASNGGLLVLRDGVFDNSAGTAEALGADSVIVIEEGELRGGQLVTDAAGRIAPRNNGLLRDVTLTPGSTMYIGVWNPGLAGTFTNNGRVDQASGAFSLSLVTIHGNVTIDGAGTWQTTNNSYNQFNGQGTNVLTHGPDHTIRGTPALGNNSLGLVNHGTIVADLPYAYNGSALTIAPGTGVNIGGDAADVINHGVLRSENAAILRIHNGQFRNNGTVEALNCSHVEINSIFGAETLNNDAGTLTGGTWRAISTGLGALLQLGGAPITRIADNTTVELGGPGSVIRVDSTPIAGTLTRNDGTLLLTGGHTLTLSNALDNAGLLYIDALSSLELGTNDLASSGMLAVGVDGVPVVPQPAAVNTSQMQLAGALAVTLEGGYTPGIGDTIQLLGSSAILGAFGQVEWPLLIGPPMTSLGLEYTATAVYLKAGLTGDLNADGFVGIADLNIVLGNWNHTVAGGIWLSGDPSGDGFVGIADLNAVLGNWNAGTPPSVNVPEPAAVGIVVLLAAIRTRR